MFRALGLKWLHDSRSALSLAIRAREPPSSRCRSSFRNSPPHGRYGSMPYIWAPYSAALPGAVTATPRRALAGTGAGRNWKHPLVSQAVRRSPERSAKPTAKPPEPLPVEMHLPRSIVSVGVRPDLRRRHFGVRGLRHAVYTTIGPTPTRIKTPEREVTGASGRGYPGSGHVAHRLS